MAHVFTVKSNANRALKAFAAKHPGLAEALSVSAVGAGFVVKVGPFDSADDELRTLATDAGLELVEFAAEGEELSADERLAHADEVIAHADATIAANAELLAEVAPIASPEELDLPDGFRLGREAVIKALAPAAEPEVFPTRGKAQVAAFERGLGVFTIRKADGGYVIDENASAEGFKRAPAPRKPRAAKAAPAPKAPKASAGPGKFAAIREAAERGELPPAPDFSADLHKRNRGRLAQLVAMAEAGDVAGLEAFPIKPNCTSPKAMDRYRNLCVMALKACAAKPTA